MTKLSHIEHLSTTSPRFTAFRNSSILSESNYVTNNVMDYRQHSVIVIDSGFNTICHTLDILRDQTNIIMLSQFIF